MQDFGQGQGFRAPTVPATTLPPPVNIATPVMPPPMAPPANKPNESLAAALAKSAGGGSGSSGKGSSLGDGLGSSLGGGANKSTSNPGGLNKSPDDKSLSKSSTPFDTEKYGTGTEKPTDASWFNKNEVTAPTPPGDANPWTGEAGRSVAGEDIAALAGTNYPSSFVGDADSGNEAGSSDFSDEGDTWFGPSDYEDGGDGGGAGEPADDEYGTYGWD